MWLLDRKGLHAVATLDGIERPGETEFAGAVPDAPCIRIVFGGYADGRGFSAAAQLRAGGYRGTLIAQGPLIPDQARHAFQSGFDAIAIDDAQLARTGRSAWEHALANAVPNLYVAPPPTARDVASIWQARHA